MMKTTSTFNLRITALLAAGLLFGGAFYQWPLFTSNQNTYFLSGLAHAGYGYLSSDWLAQQTDHIPVFSALVSLVHALDSHWLFYALFGVIAATYAISLFAIAARPYLTTSRIHQSAVLFALLALIHSPWVLSPFSDLLPGLSRVIAKFHGLAELSTNGLAGQYILGRYLQPSAFGVLLIASIAFFVYEREFMAIVCAVLAATIHPAYVLHAAVLTAVYMTVLVSDRRARKAAEVGILAIVLILPIVLYVTIVLHPSNPLLLSQAQTILFEERIPHHAKVSAWFSENSCIQLAIVLMGVVLSYRCKRLFRILTLCAIVSAGLTILQVISGNPSLALLFPWRLSTWLVPTCTAIVLGGVSIGVAKVIDNFSPPRLRGSVRACVVCLSIAFLAGTCFWGVKLTISGAHTERYHRTVVSYAKTQSSPDQTYLVPLNYEDFRLASGLPVFVDWKSHPYRDVELVEWYDRVQLARAFYEAENANDAVTALAAIQGHATITHVILEGEAVHLVDALQVYPAFRDSTHVLLELRGKEGAESGSRGRLPPGPHTAPACGGS